MIRTTQAHTGDMGRIVLPYLHDWRWRASADDSSSSPRRHEVATGFVRPTLTHMLQEQCH